jgi:hypothetical protein
MRRGRVVDSLRTVGERQGLRFYGIAGRRLRAYRGRSHGSHVLRAVGPGLAAFGVPGTMADPKLVLYSGSNKIGENDNWGSDAQISAAATQVGAFGLGAGSKDAVLLVSLPPGAYTAQVSGIGGGGIALVEVYEVP